MDLGLNGMRAFVAASSKGLGFATAEQLAAEGADVAICSRHEKSVEAARDRLDQTGIGRAVGLVGDVADAEDGPRLVEEAVAALGGLDILVTNAGGPPSGTFDETSFEQWENAVQLTLMSAVRMIKAALPHLRQGQNPSILTITSVSVRQPIANLLLSNAIRPGVVGLTKTLSLELGPENIRANSILPGWTRTERVDELLADRAENGDGDVQAEMEKITQEIPLLRMAEPEEFGKVAAFLVSPAASFVTGAMLQVDGGSYQGLL